MKPVNQMSPQTSTEAHTLACLIDRHRARLERQRALCAILERLDAARIENAERYLAERIRRETSQDLS